MSDKVEKGFNNVLCQVMSTPPLDYSAQPGQNVSFNDVHNAAIAGRSAYKAVESEAEAVRSMLNSSGLLIASRGTLAGTDVLKAMVEIDLLATDARLESKWMASWMLHLR